MSTQAMPNHKEQIREEWTGAAPLWQKWNRKFVIQTREATELLVKAAQLSAGMNVLDLASGTGEPALSLAKAVGLHGRVVATDLVEEMVAATKQNAMAEGLSNIECRLADAEHLPFGDHEFDRVTCRFGIMFFENIQKSMEEIHRVLKPGGRLCVAVFGSLQENPLFGRGIGPFLKRLNPPLPPPPPDSPHVFRFADETKLAFTILAGGFQDVTTSKHTVSFRWPGSAEECWEAMRDLAAPFKKIFAALPSHEADQAVTEVIAGLRCFERDGRIDTTATVIIGTGTA